MQRRLGLDLEVPDEFGYWLAGFTDGEACFAASLTVDKNGYHNLYTRFVIEIREDDRAILEEIRDILKVGGVWRRAQRGGSKPLVAYYVTRNADLYHVIIPLFEKYPLRTKKARDFSIWRELVGIQYHQVRKFRMHGDQTPRQSYWKKISDLVNELQDRRKFPTQK